MKTKKRFSPEQLRYLSLLASQYPTVQAASTEIINLQAILNLPKGTEHFVSDIHGEYEAFLHMLNACSGVVKDKIDTLFARSMSKAECDELATLIYYPEEKLELVKREGHEMREWYRITLYRLIDLCRLVSSKYTRSKVRKALPKDYAYIIDELLHTHYDETDKREYYEKIINTIIEIGQADGFIEAVCEVIKHLAVDRLHIVGDIFDRGPRADIIMDTLQAYHSVDIQWGNHDVLWMGAACGSRTLVAVVLANSMRYNNIDVIETGYGISLRPLSIFAGEAYKNSDTERFTVKLSEQDAAHYSKREKLLAAQMHKAASVILFKLEGQKIMRRPEFGMEDRLQLDKIDYENQSITIGGQTFHLDDCDLPTVDPADPYALTPEEEQVIDQLTQSFVRSEKLQAHVRFLYSKGGLYKVFNGNLLFHGCIPMTEDGDFMTFSIGGKQRKGKEFLDYAEKTARKAFYDKEGSPERQFGMDFLWWLWAGRNSPIFGRDRMTTFERRLIKDEAAWPEPKNPYYSLYHDPKVCEKILKEFGLEGSHCHIINGHIPVKAKKGESPIKGGGKLIVIDGGFCRAYHSTSGIAGYTLISNSRNIRIVSHQPFEGRKDAIHLNHDIANQTDVFEWMEQRVRIAQTDVGKQLQQQVDDLLLLLGAYKSGAVPENHKQ